MEHRCLTEYSDLVECSNRLHACRIGRHLCPSHLAPYLPADPIFQLISWISQTTPSVFISILCPTFMVKNPVSTTSSTYLALWVHSCFGFENIYEWALKKDTTCDEADPWATCHYYHTNIWPQLRAITLELHGCCQVKAKHIMSAFFFTLAYLHPLFHDRRFALNFNTGQVKVNYAATTI